MINHFSISAHIIQFIGQLIGDMWSLWQNQLKFFRDTPTLLHKPPSFTGLWAGKYEIFFGNLLNSFVITR